MNSKMEEILLSHFAGIFENYFYRYVDAMEDSYEHVTYINSVNSDLNEISVDEIRNGILESLEDIDKERYKQLSQSGKEQLDSYIKMNLDTLKSFDNYKKETNGLGFFSRLDTKFNNLYRLRQYFDENGPTKKLLDEVLAKGYTDYNIKKCIRVFKNLIENNLPLKNYYYFLSRNENRIDSTCLIYKIIQKSDDINIYFDENGIKKEFYLQSLYDKTLFPILFVESEEWKKYDYSSSQLAYINFNLEKKENGTQVRYIITDGTIEQYFDEKGPNESFYIKIIFDIERWYGDSKRLFFNFPIEKLKENISDENIKHYIDFIEQNGFILSKYITSKELINIYFDNGKLNDKLLKEALFEIKNRDFLSNKKILELFSDYISPNVKGYIELIYKYGFIFSEIINSFDDIDKYFDNGKVNDNFKIYLSNNIDISDKILYNFEHSFNRNIDEDLFDIFKLYLLKKYFKDTSSKTIEKFNYLYSKFGTKLLFDIKIDSVQKLLKYDIEDIKKLFDLLLVNNESVLSYKVFYNNMFISMARFDFERKFPHLINGFTRIKSIILNYINKKLNMTDEEVLSLFDNSTDNDTLKEFKSYIDDIINTLELNEEQINDLKNAIIECRREKNDAIHKIYKKYLGKKQKDYLKYFTEELLNYKGQYSKEDGIKKLFQYLVGNMDYNEFDFFRKKLTSDIDYDSYSSKDYIDKLKMTKEELDIILSITEEDINLINDCIKNKKKINPSISKKIVKYRQFITLISTYKVENKMVDDSVYNELGVEREVQYVLEDIHLDRIFKDLDVDIFFDTIANNPDLYNLLKKVLKNFYIGKLPKAFTTFYEDRGITLNNDINEIAMYITRFKQIIDNIITNFKNQGIDIEVKDLHLYFSDVIKNISSSKNETPEIKRMIGSKEYVTFINDLGCNSSQVSSKIRENLLVKILDYLYTVDKITIPSHDMILENNNGKRINFIVGNRTNSFNICHGELTDACMRVGGVGEGLFLKCITDKNWFHIRIEDPSTHEYVSRVSGFRNGNTVYLNQLRIPASGTNYTKEDLQNFIKMYADMLIEETKDSEYPIENVFINNGCAMDDYVPSNGKKYDLTGIIQQEYNLDDVLDLQVKKDGTDIPAIDDIWTDVRSSAVLLATTESGLKTKEGYVPLKNGPENAEVYDCVRDKIYCVNMINTNEPQRLVEIDTNLLIEKINRVNSMKEKLLGVEYYDIEEYSIENGIIDGFASADWYVYIDGSNEIHYDYISEIYKDDKLVPYNNATKAKEEMEFFMNILSEKYSIERENVKSA